MKRDHYADVRIFPHIRTAFYALGFIGLLISLPLYVPAYHFYVLNLIIVYAILVIGYNILAGNTGQVSLGHAGFFAIGAYGTTLLMQKLGIPFIPALILAAFIAAFFGFLVGLPALKLEGPYLSIATLAFGLAIMHIIGHAEMFGGRTGIETPPLDLGIPKWGMSYILSSDRQKYYLFLIIALFMGAGARNIMITRVGRSFEAIRDSSIAAEVIGINLLVYKTLAFAVSAFYAGIAGGLFGFVLGFFNPEPFDLILSITFLIMAIVGGLGSIGGSVAGAALVTYLQFDLLKNIDEVPYLGTFLVAISERWFTVSGLHNVNSIILGLILIAIIIFEPSGLYGIWLRIKSRIEKTRAGAA
jgi:branched-chain amino acid transport system permease protein